MEQIEQGEILLKFPMLHCNPRGVNQLRGGNRLQGFMDAADLLKH